MPPRRMPGHYYVSITFALDSLSLFNGVVNPGAGRMRVERTEGVCGAGA